jgi:hypothetical protein
MSEHKNEIMLEFQMSDADKIKAKPNMRVTVPVLWYLGAHGDPVADFREAVILILHSDGSVTWEAISHYSREENK